MYVFLLRHGTGIKNKLLEARIMGLPIMVRLSALEGIDGPMAHTCPAASFAEPVMRLIQVREFSARLAAAGRRLVEERYAWALPGTRIRTTAR